MFHFLAIILFFFLAALLVGVSVGLLLLRKGIGFFRSAARKATGAAGSQGSRQGRSRTGAGSARRSAQTATGETIIDTRDHATANRRIFADDEGEYVDYEEEK